MRGSCWGGLGPSPPSQAWSQRCSAFSGLVLPSAHNVSQSGCNHKQPGPGPAPGQVCRYKMCHCWSADWKGEFESSAAWCAPDGETEQAEAPTGASLPLPVVQPKMCYLTSLSVTFLTFKMVRLGYDSYSSRLSWRQNLNNIGATCPFSKCIRCIFQRWFFSILEA